MPWWCCGDDEEAATANSSGGGVAKQQEEMRRKADDQQTKEAIASMVHDVVAKEPKIPSFDWRFRKGFGSVKISHQGVLAIVAQMAKGHKVSALELQSQDIGDVGAKALSSLLASDHTITNLNLSRNGITAEGAKAIASGVERGRTIRRLIFDDNPIGSVGVSAVAMAAASPDSPICHLDLGVGNSEQLDDTAVMALAEMISGSRKLVHLRLSGSQALSPGALAAVLRKLPANRTLTEMLLINCVPHTSDPTAMSSPMMALGSALTQQHSALTTLELRLPLRDIGAQVLASSLPAATALRSLSVSKCMIGAGGLAAFSTALAVNKTLTKLDISAQGEAATADEARTLEALKAIAGSLAKNRTLVDLNIAEMPMDNTLAEAFIAVIGPMRNRTLTMLRHALIPSDKLATRLDNVIAENGRLEADQRRTPSVVSTNHSQSQQQPQNGEGKNAPAVVGLAALVGSERRAIVQEEELVEIEF